MNTVERSVVRFLGWGMLIALGGVLWLVHDSIRSANQVDSSTVALVSGVSTLAGTAFGALGAILAHTNTPTQDVNVVNPPSDPVPTEPVDSGDAAP